MNSEAAEIAMKALAAIANPIKHLKELAEADGTKLNGMAAVMLSEDANWLQGQAKEALRKIKEIQDAEQKPGDRPNPFQARAAFFARRGTREEMLALHAQTLEDLMRTRLDVFMVRRSQTQLPITVTIGFKDHIAKLLVITTDGNNPVTAQILLYQNIGELGIGNVAYSLQNRIQGALSCHFCRHKNTGECADPTECRAALEYGQYRTCEKYDTEDECLRVLARVVEHLPDRVYRGDA